jgi:DNA-binding XRE family transcriptional regulator
MQKTIDFEKTPIRWIRELKNWDQTQMAEFLGISKQSYNKIDRGITNVKDSYKKLIARKFNLKSTDIFTTELPPTEWYQYLKDDKEFCIGFEPMAELEKTNDPPDQDDYLLRMRIKQLIAEKDILSDQLSSIKSQYLNVKKENEMLRSELKNKK